MNSKPRIHIFQQYYSPNDFHRAAEIDFCAYRNSRQGNIAYYLLTSTSLELPPLLANRPYIISGYGSRITYLKWLKLVEQLSASGIIGYGDWAFLLNSDIFVDETIEKILTIDSTQSAKLFVACTRHCFYGIESDPNPHMLQDAWGIQIRHDLSFPVLSIHSSIPLGFPGCDNRIARIFKDQGFMPLNLGNHINFFHVHRSNTRSYCEKDRIHGAYTFIHPLPCSARLNDLTRSIHDLKRYLVDFNFFVLEDTEPGN